VELGYGLDGPRFGSQQKRFFSSPKCPDQLWGTPSILFSGYWDRFPGVKWLAYEVTNEWRYTSLHLCAIMACNGTKPCPSLSASSHWGHRNIGSDNWLVANWTESLRDLRH